MGDILPYKKIIDAPFITSIASGGLGIASIVNHFPLIIQILTIFVLLLSGGFTLYKWASNWRGFRPWKNKKK